MIRAAGPHQVRVNRIRRQSLGMFTGNPTPPQDPTLAIASELVDSLAGDPGIRLGFTTGRRLYTGGGLYLQRTLRGEGNPNAQPALEVVPLAINTRRSLSRFRGYPPGTGPAL